MVGNAAYTDRPLRNPVNDAQLMQTTLRELGFEVQVATNVDRRGLLGALRDFEAKTRGAEVALFYFAGHGAQVGGANYLIPLNAPIRSETDVPDEALEAASVLRRIEEGRARVGLVILDACRDNPYPGANRSSTRGLARMSVPTGTIVAYATAPGSTAEDGSGDNGTYTAALARYLATPGLDIKEVFDRTAQEVERVTSGRQRPREEVALRGRLVLHDRSVITTAAVLSSPGASNGTQISDDLERERVRERMERERIAREQIDWMGERRRLEEWKYWQLQMQKDYDRIASLRGSEHLRAWSWERFLSFWSIDNPLSSDDEDLRRMAQEEIRRLRLQEATPWNDAKRDSLEPPPNFQNAGKPGYHTVRSGESLAQIANSYGANWRDIARWNQIEDTNRLVVGQVLRVVAPQSSGASQYLPLPNAQVTGTKLDRQNLESSGSASAATAQPNVNDAVRMARDREAALRVFAQGVPAGTGTGTGAGPGRGHSTVFAAPSDAYAALLLAALRPNILFTERLASGRATEVEVTAESDGRISGRRIIRSSGHRGWDDAVLRAIDRTRELPRDIDGGVPPKVVIVFRPDY